MVMNIEKDFEMVDRHAILTNLVKVGVKGKAGYLTGYRI